MLRKNQSILTQMYAFCDFLIIQLVFLIAWWVKFYSGWVSAFSTLPKQEYYSWALVYSVIAIGLGFFSRFYSAKRKRQFSFEILKIFQVHFFSLLVLISFLFIYKELNISRQFLAFFLVLNVILTISYRFTVKNVLKKLRAKGYNKQFVLIVGAGSLGRKFYGKLQQRPELGIEVVGFLDDFQSEHDAQADHDAQKEHAAQTDVHKPILGTIDELEHVLQNWLIDEVVIALPLAAYPKYSQIINVCEKAGIRSMIIPDFYDYLPARPHFDDFAGMPLINVRDIPLDDLGKRILKRGFDIVFSIGVLLVTSPLLVLIAIGVKLTSDGGIIFKQERMGLNRRLFTMYKFRSMKVVSRFSAHFGHHMADAEEQSADAGEHMADAGEQSADTGWTTADDTRKTLLGTFLRKSSLDELPQFVNVLLGQMSVVGPRPERPYYVEHFKEEIPKYMVKHHVRPGITGWAQSKGLRGDTSIEERIKHDIYYIENWTFLWDLQIILLTVFKGFFNKNAY